MKQLEQHTLKTASASVGEECPPSDRVTNPKTKHAVNNQNSRKQTTATVNSRTHSEKDIENHPNDPKTSQNTPQGSKNEAPRGSKKDPMTPQTPQRLIPLIHHSSGAGRGWWDSPWRIEFVQTIVYVLACVVVFMIYHDLMIFLIESDFL